ncbi:MAG: hypothetical protein ABR537_11960 [Gemmatimonadales bacterium]
MKRELLVVFVAAVALYVPTARYGIVQDDRAIVAANPAAHSIGAALAAFDDPYWPRESGAGLYRPITILSYAVDWTISGGRIGWLHLMNAVWHGLAAMLLVAVLSRWLPTLAAAGAGLVFAWHPVHVEAVASLVGRAELLVAVGILGAVLAARRGWWAAAVVCAGLAMFSKEHGVIAGVVILLDKWLEGDSTRSYPAGLWIGLGFVTAAFLVAWTLIGRTGASDVAAVFYGRGALGRWAIALPAVARAALLLIWPVSLSADYGPRVIPPYSSLSLAAVMGGAVIVALPVLIVGYRRRAPALAFAAAVAGLSYLPTANLLFPSGVVLAERSLYLAVALPAALVGSAFSRLALRYAIRPAALGLTVLALVCGALSLGRLPSWRGNRTQLLTLLVEHPESYRAHASAAAVLAGSGDTAGVRRQYRLADSLFAGDPYLDAAHAIFLLGISDTASAAPLIARLRARSDGRADLVALRAQFLFEWRRGNRTAAVALADSARRRYPADTGWYGVYLQ